MENNKYSSFEDDLFEDDIKRFYDLMEIYKRLDLERDESIRTLMVEFSQTPDNEILYETIVEHMRPYIIKDRIKPSLFRIPPGD